MKILLTTIFAISCILALPASADIETVPLHFDRKTSEANIKGILKGDRITDYLLRAKAGQTISIVFKPSNNSAYVNVLPPDSADSAIFIGSAGGNEWTGTLPSSGDYRIRTYLIRSAARRNESSNYTLLIGITSNRGNNSRDSQAPYTERAGQGLYDARGNIPCAQSKGQPMGTCSFGVARDPEGNAAVKVVFTDGHSRFIYFTHGRATGADLSQADGDMSFSATKEADLYKIQAGHERFEIPEAVIFGG